MARVMARIQPWPFPATNEGFGSRMSHQTELGADLWWDWHTMQVTFKVAPSCVWEVGEPGLVSAAGACGGGDALGQEVLT